MKTALTWIGLLAALAAVIAAFRLLPITESIGDIGDFSASLGWVGPVVFGALYVLGALLFVPGSLLTLAAGAVFGVVVGAITVIISATIGAALAFLIARYVLRGQVERFASRSRQFDAIDRAIERGGWRVVALLRLSPAVPFTLANYLFGLTNVRFWPYVGSSMLAMLPGVFLYTYLGYVGREGATGQGRSSAEWILLGVGVVATIAVTVYVSRLARAALAETASDEVPSDDESR